jgi:hypothetical protein
VVAFVASISRLVEAMIWLGIVAIANTILTQYVTLSDSEQLAMIACRIVDIQLSVCCHRHFLSSHNMMFMLMLPTIDHEGYKDNESLSRVD